MKKQTIPANWNLGIKNGDIVHVRLEREDYHNPIKFVGNVRMYVQLHNGQPVLMTPQPLHRDEWGKGENGWAEYTWHDKVGEKEFMAEEWRMEIL